MKQYLYMQLNNKIIILTLIAMLFLASCKQKQDDSVSTTNDEISEELPEDFLEFYKRFHEDTAYQIRHIIFPLEGMIYDSDEGEMLKHKYDQKSWIFHRPFDDQDGSFEQEFSIFSDIVTERTVDTHGAKMEMVRRFAVIDDEWHLIYYKPMGY